MKASMMMSERYLHGRGGGGLVLSIFSFYLLGSVLVVWRSAMLGLGVQSNDVSGMDWSS